MPTLRLIPSPRQIIENEVSRGVDAYEKDIHGVLLSFLHNGNTALFGASAGAQNSRSGAYRQLRLVSPLAGYGAIYARYTHEYGPL
jgi:hypothetical protein